ncbi:zinc finger protein 263-like isoform X1 [Hyperolius riggenbachi]|uniref:zinc finger protein 263-like isoform X1 n=1 Tax=Hyperolius riggenbachi TaxID=752182 RepID=UPI0035A38EB5
MAPSRKRASSKPSDEMTTASKNLKSHISSVTSELAIQTGDHSFYKAQFNLKSDNGELGETDMDFRIKNEHMEDIVPGESITIFRGQSTSSGDLLKVKDEQEERNIDPYPSQEMVRRSVSLLRQTMIKEPLQDEKWMLDNEEDLNFTTEMGKKKAHTCFCGKSYSCNSHLKRHQKSHASEELLAGGYESHSNREEKIKEVSFTCQCGRHYSNKANMKRHQKNCSLETQNNCIDTYATYCKAEEPEEKIKPYVCACGKRYTCSSHLYRHQRSHLEVKTESVKSYICECGKSYSCSSHLYRHQKTHTEEKVLLGKPTEDSIENPETVESKIKSYACFCGKSYTCSSHLYRHQRKTHQEMTTSTKEKSVTEDDELEKRYKCKCGKSYSSTSHLNRHQRKHKEQDFTAEDNDDDQNSDTESDYSRQKPFTCECGKSFILSFSLLLHKKIHCRWKSSSSD